MVRELIERVALVAFTALCTLAIACAAGVPVAKPTTNAGQTTTATQQTIQAAPDSTVHLGDVNPPPDTSHSP